jgi:glycosyltransferase involved in cell wall biosynthesis
MKMRFSVVIPVYNGERYLAEAIRSVLAQSRPADEVIVYDDGSKDASREIAASFGDSVKLLCGSDGPSGFVNGWNKAIGCASGDFLTILHQDDLLYPEFIANAESALQSNREVRHLFAVCDYVDENARKLDEFPEMAEPLVRYSGNEYVKAYQKTYGMFPHIHRCPGVMTHRSIFENDRCRYTEQAGHIADDDFFYRVGQYTDVIGLLVPMAAYRVHSASATGAQDNLKLVRRLAKDYQYQVGQWRDSSFLDLDDKRYFEYWALRYLLKSLAGALKSRDESLFEDSRKDFRRLSGEGLLNRHPRQMRRIRFLLAVEKVFGFSISALLVRRHV